MSILLAGCGAKTPAMDVPAADGHYRYENKDLGFTLSLPAQFEYYQTQRKEAAERTELAIFVPTSDTVYPQEVPGYAKPITVWIFTPAAWAENKDSGEYEGEDLTVIEGRGLTYVVRLWPFWPADWAEKWNEEMRQAILDNFKLI